MGLTCVHAGYCQRYVLFNCCLAPARDLADQARATMLRLDTTADFTSRRQAAPGLAVVDGGDVGVAGHALVGQAHALQHGHPVVAPLGDERCLQAAGRVSVVACLNVGHLGLRV